MTSAPRVTVLVSGRGSNLRALVDAQRSYDVTAVVSNNPTSAALPYAQKLGITTFCVDRPAGMSLTEYKEKVRQVVVATEPELVALAGFMMILPEQFIQTFDRKLLNIHPSLLPKFPGLDTHQRALDAREREHGCSVHFVDTGVDTGPLVAQSRVEVRADDDAHSLAARVLVQEHRIYPWVLNHIADGSIRFEEDGIRYSEERCKEASELGIRIFPSHKYETI